MKTNNLDPSWSKGGGVDPSKDFPLQDKILKETLAKETSMKNMQGGIIKIGI